MSAPHVSVMLAPVLAMLQVRPGGRYVDLTLGAGGHSEAILEASSPGGVLVGFDRDPRAHEIAGARLARFGDRFVPVRATFDEVGARLAEMGWGEVDGILLDAGVSSMQLDEAERGFSFRFDAPLDMRMGQEGVSAGDLIDRMDEDALTQILREYGEMPGAHRVARALKTDRAKGLLQTTGELASLCARVIRKEAGRSQTHPATRVFQALRIAVNDELGQLDRALEQIPGLLAPGGVAAVISFHSLEDRRVKRAFRDRVRPKYDRALAGLPMDASSSGSDFVLLKDVEPDAQECEMNPRARSARLRGIRRRDEEVKR